LEGTHIAGVARPLHLREYGTTEWAVVRDIGPSGCAPIDQTRAVADPGEGLDRDGLIRTSASVDRIPNRFRPVLEATAEAIRADAPDASVYAYGSVTTGQATSPGSDVDILTIGLDDAIATRIGARQSVRFRDLCRAVEIAAASPSDFAGDSDEAYGGRVFLHHYCVHLAGADLDTAITGFPGDHRAARGFNGDIGRHLARWRATDDTTEPADWGRRIARKTLLAVAGLVSIHDATWTTDRERAAGRWSEVHPRLHAGLEELVAWAVGGSVADREAIHRSLDGVVASIVEQFATDIGLWTTAPT
jgi:hypothetical protein